MGKEALEKHLNEATRDITEALDNLSSTKYEVNKVLEHINDAKNVLWLIEDKPNESPHICTVNSDEEPYPELFSKWIAVFQEVIDLRPFFDKHSILNPLREKVAAFSTQLYKELGTGED